VIASGATAPNSRLADGQGFFPATVRGQPFCAVAAKLIQKKNSAIAAFTPRLVINQKAV
jgi:ABC-type Fe2+-enterobactin transport system substrate-binding protein